MRQNPSQSNHLSAIIFVILLSLVSACLPEAPATQPAETVPTTFGARLDRVKAFCDAPDDVVVEPIGAVTLRGDDGRWTTAYFNSQIQLDVQAEVGRLRGNTRYFVYAVIPAGIARYEVSQDPPDNRLEFALGNERRAFVTTFYTDRSGPHVLRYAQAGRNYRYTYLAETEHGAVDNVVLSKGRSRTQVSVPFNDSLWLGMARLVTLQARLTGGSAGGMLSLGPVNFWIPTMILNAGNYDSTVAESTLAILPLDNLRFDYKTDDDANCADVWVAGFQF